VRLGTDCRTRCFSRTKRMARAWQNLGGMATSPFVPPRGAIEGVRCIRHRARRGVIDGSSRAPIRPSLLDVDGKLALAGKPNMRVVSELMNHPYFQALLPHQRVASCSTRLRTEAIANTPPSARATRTSSPPQFNSPRRAWLTHIGDSSPNCSQVLVSGGGAKNPALFAAIEKRYSDIHPSF